jgi:hypothetical protein
VDDFVVSQLLSGPVLTPLELAENKLRFLLERFPDYHKTLSLAVAHEETAPNAMSYQGWQWHDVETHPTRLIRLVIEGISRINLKTRQATYYVLRDRDVVKMVLSGVIDNHSHTHKRGF